ncbi:MAG: YgiT-type zinc finger protein [Deltaproteobacteria bacterium]|nr:YgiT-type zinc finger protein [Deltaproteobacteria bacterium]MBW1911199.1 YgiT-type zinc finger protein [Deltaproteobacteria bacterium]MBW2034747.1 YgiT-type zinc finger protein [Deltaproteobacteria bacterium]MBW2115858.1 YgiT-type zinc finger protein [Deltaproteobacteria bacterium]MBW2168743.1 YgiT-type zinc finger protein [Deltaproteobacteria bacterium]
MKCSACYSEMVNKKGEIDLRIGGRLFIVRNVIYEECLSCGEKVLPPEVSEFLFEKIKNEDFIEQIIHVPILDGTYG